jgi:hypothetical protein
VNRIQLMAAMVLSMAVLLVTTYKAFAQVEPEAPRMLSREEQVEYLRLGLMLNGGDTTRWGPVDLSKPYVPPPPKIVQSVPIVPDPAPLPAARPSVKPAGADICRRHGMRKVQNGSSWRCRK